MKRKSIKLMTTTFLLSSILSFSGLAAWEQVDGAWKYKDEVTEGYVASQWIESTVEQGLWYYINVDGVMAVNTLIDGIYYVNEMGEWREGSSGGSTKTTTPSTGQKESTNSWSAEINLDDWDPGSLNVEDILGEETANSLAEAINNAR